jgi:hypothetical protein
LAIMRRAVDIVASFVMVRVDRAIQQDRAAADGRVKLGHGGAARPCR